MRFTTIFLCIFIFAKISFAAPSPPEKTNTTNRFKDGPHMIANDIEYISAKSVTKFSVFYNLYIHPKLVLEMGANVFSSEYQNAHERLRKNASEVCNKIKKADLCTVYLWTNLAAIPTAEETASKNLEYVKGIYEKAKEEKKGKFVWYNSKPTLPENAKLPSKEEQLKEQLESGENE